MIRLCRQRRVVSSLHALCSAYRPASDHHRRPITDTSSSPEPSDQLRVPHLRAFLSALGRQPTSRSSASLPLAEPQADEVDGQSAESLLDLAGEGDTSVSVPKTRARSRSEDSLASSRLVHAHQEALLWARGSGA